jgi:hypothetical protein
MVSFGKGTFSCCALCLFERKEDTEIVERIESTLGFLTPVEQMSKLDISFSFFINFLILIETNYSSLYSFVACNSRYT